MITTTEQGPAVHEWTGPTGVQFRDIREPSGTYYREGTPRAVIDALEAARVSRARVRFFYGDRETGKGWLEEYDVTGRIGRSTGRIPIALLIPTRRSTGGGGILADCIVRLIVQGRGEVYRHPGYEMPSIITGPEGKHADLPFAAWVNTRSDEQPHARFRTMAAADRWAAFMRGERWVK